MVIKESKFIKSVINKVDFPNEGLNEIAIVGRSNVGKSSIINSLLNRKKIAKVSSTPGKTRTVNFFLINNQFYLVDFPGYGYAKVSKSEKNMWKGRIESYFYDREELKRVILLIDSRHEPFESDMAMFNWINYLNYPIKIVATKSDKLKNAELKKNQKMFIDRFGVDEVFFYSSLKGNNRDHLVNFIFSDI